LRSRPQSNSGNGSILATAIPTSSSAICGEPRLGIQLSLRYNDRPHGELVLVLPGSRRLRVWRVVCRPRQNSCSNARHSEQEIVSCTVTLQTYAS
jgi:hypothetical protein